MGKLKQVIVHLTDYDEGGDDIRITRQAESRFEIELHTEGVPILSFGSLFREELEELYQAIGEMLGKEKD